MNSSIIRSIYYRKHIFSLLIIVLFALIFLTGSIEMKPFDDDNLFSLSLATKSAKLFFIGKFLFVPAYRPFLGLLIRMQYKVVGLNFMESYFIVNLCIWVACVMCLYGLVYYLTRSQVSSLIAALAFLLDRRIAEMLEIIGGRSTSFAILCGLLVVLLIFRKYGKNFSFLDSFFIYLLLVISSLNKEHFLAFSVMAGYFLFFTRGEKRYKWTIPLFALLTYFAMRYFLAPESFNNQIYCIYTGFFSKFRTICYSDLSFFERIAQYSYNIGASFIGTFFPCFFKDGMGILSFNWGINEFANFVFYSFVFIAAFIGILKRKRYLFPMLILIFSNSVLNLMLYRERHHVIGMAALYIAAGVGLSHILLILNKDRLSRFFLVSLLVFFCFMLGVKGEVLRKKLTNYAIATSTMDPCEAYFRFPNDINLEMVKRLKEKYGLMNQDCLP